MLERIKLEESFIGNTLVVTYDSYDPKRSSQDGLFETVIFSPRLGRQVMYSEKETEAIINHERACRQAIDHLIILL